MFYDLHVTTRAEREAIVANCPFRWIDVDPRDVVAIDPPPVGGFTLENHRGKSMVWEEDTGEWREQYFRFIYDVIDGFNRGERGHYAKAWKARMGETAACTREDRLHGLYLNMKAKGFKPELGDWGGICVEATGQRLDGSYRASVASYLGITTVRAKEYVMTRQTVDKRLLARLIEGDRRANGPDYYAIDFGGGLRNFDGDVPRNCLENVAKADAVLEAVGDIKGKRVLDLGCNAGYVSIRAAMRGAEAHGVDTCLIPSANLYKLAFSFIHELDLDATFERADIVEFCKRTDQPIKYDVALVLNVLYHLPEREQVATLRRIRRFARKIVLQGNNEKGPEYYGASVKDMTAMLEDAGWRGGKITAWKKKPIVIATA